MLTALSIRDVVLIDRLDLTFGDGLAVFTGETGAGKSILLDSLSLALGARADSGLVRKGADRLSVTASFAPAPDHPAWTLLTEAELEADPAEPLVVRRVVTADGRSRAHVNDHPSSVGLLRRLGALLVEIHGQFDTQGLLDPATHGAVLDALSPEIRDARAEVARSHAAWRAAAKARATAEADLARARAEEDHLRHTLAELEALAPEVGEEARLAETRSLLMNGEKVASALSSALDSLSSPRPAENPLLTALRELERAQPLLDPPPAADGGEASPARPSRLAPIIEGLDRAAVEITEAKSALESLAGSLDLDPRRLEAVEERLFALRGLARKHTRPVDALPPLMEDTRRALDALDGDETRIAALMKAEEATRTAYLAAARTLSEHRRAGAQTLDAAVARELPPLKLDRARFETRVAPLPESQWGPEGLDAITFLVATNPGADPGPLHKIASGGELARFMLALKVVLAAGGGPATLVFDEVDTGIGGATAAAVGERLARLAQAVQVLVVTHSPQVAAQGTRHFKVSKVPGPDGGLPGTRVTPLSATDRREEVARMLAGAEITDQARAAAHSLLDSATARHLD